MTPPTQEIVIPARIHRRSPAWQFVAVFSGLFLEVFIIYIFESSTWIRYLLYILRAWQIAALLPLVMFIVAFVTVSVASLSLGFRINYSLAARTSVAGLWVAPFLIFLLIRSWGAVVFWFLLVIEFAQLIAFVMSFSRKESAATNGLHPSVTFAGLPSGKAWNTDSFFSAYFLIGAIWAAICLQLEWAGLALAIATVALIRRSAKMLLDSPSLKPFHAARRVPAALMIVALLFAFLWLPRGGPGYDGSLQQAMDSLLGLYMRPVKARVAKPHGPQSMPLVTDIFPGVLLYPDAHKRTKVVAPRPASGQGFSPSAKPFVIPFDGVYWLWQPPANRPPKTAIIKYGSPAKLGFHSTDNTSLWMEAHQNLGTQVDLACCSAIQVVIENHDSFPKTSSMELIADNADAPNSPRLSLGIQPIPPIGLQNEPSRNEQTLTFQVPRQSSAHGFNELTVSFRLNYWRGGRSAKIAIRQFILIPRR